MPPLRAVLAVLLFIVPAAAAGQPEWLPADIMESLITDLAGRLQAVDPAGDVVGDDGVAMARSGISGTVARIESRGADGILSMTPDFPELGFPSSGDRYIDAIARWGMCALVAQVAYVDSVQEEGALGRRVTAAAMTTTVTLVNTFLRHEYLKAGGADQQVREFYASPEVTSAIEQLRSSGPLVVDTMGRCLDPLQELMD